MDPTPTRMTLVPFSTRYDLDDERWTSQVAQLRRSLQHEVGLDAPARTTPGTKGSVDELIVALGTSGAITAVVEIVRAFLDRDRTRNVEMTWTDAGGNERYVRVTAEGAASDALRPVVEALGRQLGHS